MVNRFVLCPRHPRHSSVGRRGGRRGVSRRQVQKRWGSAAANVAASCGGRRARRWRVVHGVNFR